MVRRNTFLIWQQAFELSADTVVPGGGVEAGGGVSVAEAVRSVRDPDSPYVTRSNLSRAASHRCVIVAECGYRYNWVLVGPSAKGTSSAPGMFAALKAVQATAAPRTTRLRSGA